MFQKLKRKGREFGCRKMRPKMRQFAKSWISNGGPLNTINASLRLDNFGSTSKNVSLIPCISEDIGGSSALGQKQTFALHQAMSALPPIATSIAFFGMSAWTNSGHPDPSGSAHPHLAVDL